MDLSPFGSSIRSGATFDVPFSDVAAACAARSYHFAQGLDPQQFCELVQTRQVLVSADGATVAQLHRQGSQWSLLHPSASAEFNAEEARLLRVRGDDAVFWAKRPADASGVYRASGGRKPELLVRLDKIHSVRTNGEQMLVRGRHARDLEGFDRYVTAEETFARWKEDIVSISTHGELLLLSAERISGHDRWIHRLWKDGASHALYDMQYTRPGASVVPFGGWYSYAQNLGESFLVRKPKHADGHGELFDGSLVDAWGSPDERCVVHLVRHGAPPDCLPQLERDYGPRHELLVNGIPFSSLDGHYALDPTDFRWSGTGHAFGALIRRVQCTSEGERFWQERLVASSGETYEVPTHMNLREWQVDEDGRIVAFILADGRGRRLILDGEEVAQHAFIWNLNLDGTVIRANILADRRISRIHFNV